jgi:hypothetical protein
VIFVACSWELTVVVRSFKAWNLSDITKVFLAKEQKNRRNSGKYYLKTTKICKNGGKFSG